MSATIVQIVLLWAAVFIGLDLSFGEGALTDDLDKGLQRALKWVRQLLWPERSRGESRGADAS